MPRTECCHILSRLTSIRILSQSKSRLRSAGTACGQGCTSRAVAIASLKADAVTCCTWEGLMVSSSLSPGTIGKTEKKKKKKKSNSHVLVCFQIPSSLQCPPTCLSSACICMKRASARCIVSGIFTLSALASCKFWDSKGKLLPDTMPEDATGCHRNPQDANLGC